MNLPASDKWYTVFDNELAIEVREKGCGFEARLPDASVGQSFFCRSLGEAFVRGWQAFQPEEEGIDG